jgi:hypothetical protein
MRTLDSNAVIAGSAESAGKDGTLDAEIISANSRNLK